MQRLKKTESGSELTICLDYNEFWETNSPLFVGSPKIKIDGNTYLSVKEYMDHALRHNKMILERRKRKDPHYVLDESEKKYLKGIIAPYRDCGGLGVEKRKMCNGCYRIIIWWGNLQEIDLPPFWDGEPMYMGMEENKTYTIKELGL